MIWVDRVPLREKGLPPLLGLDVPCLTEDMMKSDAIPFLVSDLMTDDVITVSVDERIGRVRDLVLGLGFHAVPVVEGDRVVGIVTTLDLADDWHDRTPVRDVMSRRPYRIAHDATLAEAAETMVRHEVHHLLVENDHAITGLISTFDMLGAFGTDTTRRG